MIIYKTTNLITGKIYIGKDSLNDPTYLGSGLILERSIKKYGIQNFQKDILEHCISKKHLDEREVFWIKTLNSTDKTIGYNIAKGGTGGNIYEQLSNFRKKRCVEKRESTRPQWDTPEYRKKISDHSKKLWENSNHKEHMKKVMTGRVITWKNKISDGNKKFWEEHGDMRDECSKRRGIEITRKKMTGYEFKDVPELVKQRILTLYQTHGPKLISIKLLEEDIEVSRYLVVRVLKKEGIYQKWQKGIGDKSKKHASISRRAKKSPHTQE